MAKWFSMKCSECGWPVIEGPDGGYVCGQCLHTVLPDGYDQRRYEGLVAAREERLRRQYARR